jgi:hypothetical protein
VTRSAMVGRLFVALACLLMSALAAGARAQLLDPDAYQSFVGNWSPKAAPLCTAMENAGEWESVLHPAPVMGGNKAFEPPSALWNHHAVLLLARVVNAGDTAHVFRLLRVTRTRGAIEMSVTFAPTPPASSTMKWYMALAVAKPLPPRIRIRENGAVICTLAPGATLPEINR